MSEVAFTVETLNDLSQDICVGCTEDTSFGTGRFVNRIGADAVAYCYETEEEIEVDGYLCWECRATDCDFCDKKTLEPQIINASGQLMCEECNEKFIAHYIENGYIPERISDGDR
tara:strand:- start:3523 stop:3867 length:345 start_codon:yes stop_codon:yes gene_type:complete